MEDRIEGAVLLEKGFDRLGPAEIAGLEARPPRFQLGPNVVEVSHGEIVRDQDGELLVLAELRDEVGADKSGSADHQALFHNAALSTIQHGRLVIP